MSVNIANFNMASARFLKDVNPAAVRQATAEEVADYNRMANFSSPNRTDEEEAAFFAGLAERPADNAPENVWARIVSGGKVVGEVYKSGAYSVFASSSISIDPDASPEQKANRLAKALGGTLQAGPAYSGVDGAVSSSRATAAEKLRNQLLGYY